MGMKIKERAEIEQVERAATYYLEPACLAVVQRLITWPPEPTDALRSLMAFDSQASIP